MLAAAILQPTLPGCFPVPPDDIVEAALSLVPADGSPRTVALTLDACSGAADMRILDTLTRLSIPATIFVTSLWLRANAQTLALLRARADLFTLQNHGERHLPAVLGTRRLYGLAVAGTLDAIHREVAFGADAVAEARAGGSGAPRPRWYRGATGLYSPAAIGAIQAMGCLIAGYSLNADAGASLPAASVARRIASARSGDIMIAHLNQPHRPSGAGVAAGVAELHRAGTVFVDLDALPATALTCRPRA